MNKILDNVKVEQRAQFRNQIRDYYERERKFDVMPMIRINPKSKNLDFHK